ncbi:MAG: hypothetical protein II670_00730 [Alphaproteobacteria bacterium]|nr:hypothetical protein [Alphaproteobacteria bacterium]
MNRIEEQARYFRNIPLLCNGAGVAFKTDVLDKSIHTDGYLEIDNVQSDLRIITSTE